LKWCSEKNKTSKRAAKWKERSPNIGSMPEKLAVGKSEDKQLLHTKVTNSGQAVPLEWHQFTKIAASQIKTPRFYQPGQLKFHSSV
jgi:hypothetical protein